MARLGALVGTSLALGLVIAVGCGSSDDSTFGGSSGSSGDGSSGSSGFGSSGDPNNKPCQGLACKQVACGGGGSTSLSGKVFLPEGTVPLYNAIVYVPNAPLTPFTEGVACDKCGGASLSNPIATALTDASGSFVLKNVPVGTDFPLVIQVGRWRRQVTIPAITAQCTDTALAAATTRLPRNKTEGDIPKIAITTGGADSLECFLRKLGIDDSEITNVGGTGRVHLFQGLRSSNDGSKIDGSTTSGQSLWDSAASLNKYDMVILSCEGDENNGTKSTAARGNLKAYLDAGGRVFASHFHYVWFKNGTAPLPTTATWTGANTDDDRDVTVDTTFAKGQAFSQWLTNVNATKAPDIVAMTELRSNVTSVPASGSPPDTARRWLYVPRSGTSFDTKFYSFNAPIGVAPDNQCGRGVYTDIHVSSGDASGGTFPANCTTTGLSPQEKALLFLFMDLASCIQDDSKPPEPPPAVK